MSAAFEEPMPQLKTLARDGKQLKLADCRATSLFLHTVKFHQQRTKCFVCLLRLFLSMSLEFLLRLPTSVRELLGSKADGIADKISELNADRGGLQVVVAGTPTASGPPTPRGADHPEGSRTLCRPVFEADDRPINASRIVANFEHLSQQEFELTKVNLGPKIVK